MFRRKNVTAFSLLILGLLLMIPISGCGTVYGYASVNPEYHLLANKKIAVITGTNEDIDFIMATKVADVLMKSGAFVVIPQSELSKKIPKYPLNFRLIDVERIHSAEKVNTPWIPDEAKDQAGQLAESLHVDYLFIVWSDWMQRRETNWSYMTSIAMSSRMIDVSSKEVVGYSGVVLTRKKGILQAEEQHMDELYEYAATFITQDILKNANATITGK